MTFECYDGSTISGNGEELVEKFADKFNKDPEIYAATIRTEEFWKQHLGQGNSDGTLQKLMLIFRKFQQLYEDNFSINLDPHWGITRTNMNGIDAPVWSNISITVRYPEVTITNSNNESHTIKELYVKHSIELSSFLFHSVIGNRLEITEKEASGGYRHSHLPSRFFSR